MIPDSAQFRDRTHYLAAVATEVAAPLLRSYASARAHGVAVPPLEWRRGLIMGSGHIGDVLYRTCSLERLARGLPSCKWSYLTTRDGGEILQGNPALTEVLAFNRETAVDFVPPYSARELRAREFDVVLCTDNIAHHRALWLAARLGIPNRVAFVQKGFSGLATLPVVTARAPWPEQIRTMVDAITGTTDATPLRPRMYLGPADSNDAQLEWDNLPHPDASLTLAAAITTRQRLGTLPHSLLHGILRCVLEQAPRARVVLTGTSADAARLGAMAAALGPRALVSAGRLKLRSFSAFLTLCDAFVGADSGPRHLANAAGIPVFFVRNMGAPEIETGRYCDTEFDIAPPGEYLPQPAVTHSLESVDHRAVANAIIAAARARRERTV